MAKKTSKTAKRSETLEERLSALEQIVKPGEQTAAPSLHSPFFVSSPTAYGPAGIYLRVPPLLPFGPCGSAGFWVQSLYAGQEAAEKPVEPWEYLVHRQHPWRKQLYVKGRNMTARQLVGGIKANQFDEKQASENYKLPVEAIREALSYVEKNKELLEIEAEIERLMHKRGGVARGPQPVS
jgi:uncharacterized protein (DUF433 family)